MKKLLLETQKQAKAEEINAINRLIERVAEVTTVPDLQRNLILTAFGQAAELLLDKAELIKIRFGHDTFGWWLEISDNGPINDRFESEVIAEAGSSSFPCDRISYSPGRGSSWNCLRLAWADIASETVPKILIVEDEGILRTLYKMYLGNNYAVESVSSGLEAIDALHASPADLVISDIEMPGMDGLTLREKLVEDPNTELMPFVFLTGYEDDNLVERATSLGIDDYLVKPVTREQLLRTVERVLGRTQQIIRRISERIDKRITASLAPSLPTDIPGWRMAFATRNTGSGGGDFLFHQRQGGNTLLFLADIMGHDDTAKFFSFSYGGYIRGLIQSSEFSENPAALLEQLSLAALQDQLLSQTTLTCTAITLMPSGKVALASAAHPPPIRLSKAGPEVLSVGGMLPGVLPDPGYQIEWLQLQAGERIALYTDGLFEAADDETGRQHLEEQILLRLSNTLEDSIETALEQVMALFDELTGTPARDDTLLLLLEPDRDGGS
ncbi:MAG: SpoIIE family protein phosphatase [Gammaproteobacteria bacterium]|nr:SpoIIE family protein phosphatase [Gammaproteobacteria bacterium]MBU1655211.1 SpoIIE family protein phosphatase [Gammaproteobacteria bacterium]MBU1961111.1 SpoIIE family protein phosphatase [Gammaproteobacteria bacterium]